ncbi:GntR family transcriptional regulator [Nocardia sp. SYP-A9097]|uniref:GntR family transcriptional regulator n=1 Tax=Nocardia sp. SYP-A9097 TaxID=2663237 RepID=UPI001891D922|nr:GntR family transcriptional regulator [Nocardia sp. SYP-A9097]
MPPTRSDIDTVTAAERAYSYIRQRLFDGTYEGGAMLSEGEIAAALKISRTPVHEALLRCEFEGHVRMYPKRGALVLPVSAKEIQDVLVTRRLIETYAIEKACETGFLGPGLLALVEKQAELIAAGKDDVFSDSDSEFHHRIVTATGNTLLTKAYGLARDVPLRVGNGDIGNDPDRAAHIIEEHAVIAQAVVDRDPIAARAAVELHLDHALQSLLRAI